MEFDRRGRVIRGNARKTGLDTSKDVVIGLESQYPGISDSVIKVARQMVDPGKVAEFDALVNRLAKQLQSCRDTD